MYQVVTEITVDGKREIDMVHAKIYSKKGWAKRAAKDWTLTHKICDDRTMEKKSYVRGFLQPATKEEAKKAYCKCKRIWIDSQYGHERLRNSWEYGSHASAEELFYRSIEQTGGYGYDGNYYIEYEE